MRKTVLLAIIFWLTGPVYGDENIIVNNGQGYPGNFVVDGAATVGESYLRGMAARDIAQGYRLEQLGIYENLHEDARRKRIGNYIDRIHAYWQIRDEYKKRLKAEQIPWTVREKHRLDMAEEKHALAQRRQKLIEEGILPKPPEPSITIRGKKYSNVAEWRQTYDYVLHSFEMDEQRLLGEIEKLQQEKRHKQSIAWIARYEKLGYSGQQDYHTRRRLAARFGESYEPFAIKTPTLDREIAIKETQLKWVRLAQVEASRRMKERGEL